MFIDSDKKLEWDGTQFVLTVINQIKDRDGNPTGKFSEKTTYHTSIDQLSSKLMSLQVGKLVQTYRGTEELKSFYDLVSEAVHGVVFKIKMNAMVGGKG